MRMKFISAIGSLGALGAALLFCLVLASCASLVGPRRVELPLARLQQGLEQRFPIDQRMLELFDVRFSNPQLAILSEPDNDRIAMTLDVSVTRLFQRQPRSGSLGLSGVLFVDAARNAVFLRDARIDKIAFDGLEESTQQRSAKLATLVVGQMLKDAPIYSFRPEDLRHAGVQFVPTAISIVPGALVVTVEPVK